MARPALAATRALQVIDLFVLHPKEQFNLTEVSKRTGINSASAHALLTAMARQGYVQRHEPRKTYSLGPALVAAGTIALVQLEGLRLARAELDKLARALDLEVFVTMVAGDELLIVDTSSYTSAYGAVVTIGQRLPMWPPMGSAFMAWSSGDEIDRWLARAEPALSPAEAAEQRTVLGVVRGRGFAVGLESDLRRELVRTFQDRREPDEAVVQRISELSHAPYLLSSIESDQPYDVGMIAAPIFDAEGRPEVAMALSGFQPQLLGREVARLAEHLCGTTRRITKRSGGRIPDGLQ